jgi:hypothetical protein
MRDSIVKMTSEIVYKNLQKLQSQLSDTSSSWKGNLDLTVIATAKVMRIFFCSHFFLRRSRLLLLLFSMIWLPLLAI